MKINSNAITDISSSLNNQIAKPLLHEWVGQAMNTEDPHAVLTQKITEHLSFSKNLDPFQKLQIEEFSKNLILASYTIYDRSEGTLTVYPGNEENPGSPQTFEAHNNTTTDSNGPWPNGDYNYERYRNHEESGPNDSYGSNGNFIFTVPGRSNMGIHAGRADKGGPSHLTLGCIRTTDEGTEYLRQLNEEDPIELLRVQD